MNSFKRILVAMDCSYMDARLLAYYASLRAAFDPEAVYFFHAESNLAKIGVLKDRFAADFESMEPLDEAIETRMRALVEKHLEKEKHVERHFEVVEGSPFDQIMHWVDVKKIDLVIMGKKDVGKGSGIVSRKIARNIHCSVLFVPEQGDAHFNRIIVPIDFSAHSRAAVQLAVQLAHALGGVRVTCLNVYDVPAQHFNILRSFGQFQSVMEENAREAYSNFIDQSNFEPVDLQAEFVPNETYDIAKHINRFALGHPKSLLLLGAQGHSKLELLMLGSVTEKVLLYHDQSPILITKLD